MKPPTRPLAVGHPLRATLDVEYRQLTAGGGRVVVYRPDVKANITVSWDQLEAVDDPARDPDYTVRVHPAIHDTLAIKLPTGRWRVLDNGASVHPDDVRDWPVVGSVELAVPDPEEAP